MTPTAETVSFQAETQKVLDLVIHSLYSHKEIFLRELISNASDALDKLRVEALQHAEWNVDPDELEIHLATSEEPRLLVVTDNGIGMSRDEVVDNLGTIAKSGTKAFLEALAEAKDAGTKAPELIGQFGVGFYSAFMVADEIVVETRRAGEERGTRWVSQGGGTYTIEAIEKPERGTTITLHLKPVEGDDAQDFTQEWTLREIVRKYSDFLEYPIKMEVTKEEEQKVETLNSQKPLWTRPKSEITQEQYAEFYRHVARDFGEPLDTIHFRAEGVAEYTALLFLPKRRPMDLFSPEGAKCRVNLYVKRVFIMDDCEELLPVWLRFVRGVVDSQDLPLNISRETLQHNRQLAQMRARLTKKVLESLTKLAKNDREAYVAFWEEFGEVLKEGLYYGGAGTDELAKIALFESSKSETPVTLPELLERKPVAQRSIYVAVAKDRETALRSPHLEAFTKRGFEVLFLTSPVDEFVLQRFTEFDGVKIERIDQGTFDLEDEDEPERDAKEQELAELPDKIQAELADRVEAVRFTNRLTDSPACLVEPEHALSPELRRMLAQSGQDLPPEKHILELNAKHPLVQRIHALIGEKKADERFVEACALLLGQAELAAGRQPSDPTRFSKLLVDLMLRD
ncbi:MAG: molecular chaperone HtpG [Planctomycetota bacterium]